MKVTNYEHGDGGIRFSFQGGTTLFIGIDAGGWSGESLGLTKVWLEYRDRRTAAYQFFLDRTQKPTFTRQSEPQVTGEELGQHVVAAYQHIKSLVRPGKPNSPKAWGAWKALCPSVCTSQLSMIPGVTLD